jgi:DNA polymerase-1
LEEAGKECVLISGDKDYYQLVSPKTSLWRIIPSTAKEKYEKTYNINFDAYTTEHNLPVGIFETKYGDGVLAEGEVVNLMPEQFVDYLAVVGDKSDNIPGVDRVGPKSIIPLLKEYGSLDNIYSIIHYAENNGKTKELAVEWKNKLGIKTSPINAFLKNEENARLSQKLAKIETNVDEELGPIENYKMNINKDGLRNVIERYEMWSLRGII